MNERVNKSQALTKDGSLKQGYGAATYQDKDGRRVTRFFKIAPAKMLRKPYKERKPGRKRA